MKPAWDALMAEYKDSTTTLIADVDCTAGGKALCDQNGVRGYPTIKYGAVGNLEDYKGGRSADALKEFAKSNLGPTCGPGNLDLCDDDKKKQIEEFMAMPTADLDSKIEDKKAEMKAAETTFESEVKKLQEKYEQLQKDKDATIASVKDSGLGLMQSVKAHKKKNDEL